jgi:hypothetical protein
VNHGEEAVDGALGRADLALHAAARVQNDADADRQVPRWREVIDRLGLLVFLDDEVVDGEIRYRPFLLVDDRRDHVDQRDVNLQLSAQQCVHEQEHDRRRDNRAHLKKKIACRSGRCFPPWLPSAG